MIERSEWQTPLANTCTVTSFGSGGRGVISSTDLAEAPGVEGCYRRGAPPPTLVLDERARDLVRRGHALGQRPRVHDRLTAALGQVRCHRVGGVAEQRDASDHPSPCRWPVVD